MSSDFGNDFIVIEDDEGTQYELEHLDTIYLEDDLYMVFVPADLDEDDEDFGLIILKVVERENEDVFSTVDDEDELNAAYALFIERLSDEEELSD